ncbi:MAG: cobaltochelatase subunit CobN [Deltaproteobacteria bacterium]|nr:cobaltochelatase subunit CobN [Candidatus Anaeroferrophillacea bacterium]
MHVVLKSLHWFAGVILGFGLCCFLAAGPAAATETVVFLVGDADAFSCAQAIDELDLSDLDVRVITGAAIVDPAAVSLLADIDVAVVDIMPEQPAGWLRQHVARLKPGARVYAVRGSSHTEDYLKAGFLLDETVRDYFRFTSGENIRNLITFLARRDLGLPGPPAPAPVLPPKNGLYHPDAPHIFADLDSYVEWYRLSGHLHPGGLWNLGVVFPGFPVAAKKAPLDALMRAYERQGINTVTWLREIGDWPAALDKLLATRPLAGELGSITGFAFKFSARMDGAGKVLARADVPVFNPHYLFFSSGEEWAAAVQGLAPPEVGLQLAAPELAGLIEPTVAGLREVVPDAGRAGTRGSRYVAESALVEKLARRAANWHRLRRMANGDKKIVLVYYNHGGGKQNIGASYLNVFRSIEEIIANLKAAGYGIEGEPREEEIKDLLQKSGRNIGSWAPGELERLLASGTVVKIPLARYRQWLDELDPGFREKAAADWERPEDSTIMMHDGNFIIPAITLGNLTLVAQPSRGWGDDPQKLYHSPILYPHHQYTAFYLWLQHELKPDAMISLGTHGTHEWLPGKQAGLSATCPPEILLGDIPSLYPYIVDDVGEGIQAKRRGRGVIIDHATPPFRAGGLYEEYAALAGLISEYESAGSGRIQAARLERIRAMCVKLGLDRDLGLAKVDEDSLEKIEHYLIELKTEMIPYGLHTFGRSPTGAARRESAAAIAARGGQPAAAYEALLDACGPAESAALLHGLDGGYIGAAIGNDPLRNPESLPTGKNFYGFDPARVPSREAWVNGQKAADELVAAYRDKYEGAYPEKIGVILWSVETMRDEGIGPATALALMGMEPVWDRRDKVGGVRAIPGARLGRPRVDVLMQMSGLFRDTFPNVALLLDDAVRQAAVQGDVENFIRRHSGLIRDELTARGMAPARAEKLSLVRIFSARPGAYGTKVDEFTGSSGLWDDDRVIVDSFIDMVSCGYARDLWGEPLAGVYRDNLAKVNATVHSLGSNLYATMDNDDMFQYLGGLSLAVRTVSGKNPEVFVSVQKTLAAGHVEELNTTIGRELRSRYLNPRWIEGMKKEKYAGARDMAEFVENMWGWQVTTPETIDATKWQETFEVYVEDKYGQELREFFNRENPWAYQSLTARMLESVRKGYWRPAKEVETRLAAEYAVSVVEKGVACCDHTCNNPQLNQMVANLISLPGVVAPEVAARFKLAIEKMAAKPLAEQVADREKLLQQLKDAPNAETARASASDRQAADRKTAETKPEKKSETTAAASGAAPKPDDAAETVKGYKMEDIKTADQDTQMSSSGIQWAASLFILLLLGLFFFGSRRRRR